MPLLLRVDVDKPFGNSNFTNAVRSKLCENYWYPKNSIFNRGYLNQLAAFLEHCNREQISGYFYYRMCTIPDTRINNLMISGGHKAGVHAENTKSFESFQAEWNKLQKLCELELDSFSKHGSGNLKLGKHHYAPYEPEKYISWAAKMNVKYQTGNDLCTSIEDFDNEPTFFPKIFWIERDYRSKEFESLQDVIEAAKTRLVPVLIHPSNYDSTKEVKDDFTELIALAKKNNVSWSL